jgi:phosphoribosylamine--glycine ligase
VRVCVVGSGAREHALALVLGRSADVVVTPGNPGITGRTPEGHSLTSTPVSAEEIDADLFVIGPEAPLVDGLADRLRSAGKAVFGPGAAGARLEGSKQYMKDVASRAGVPTARWRAFGGSEAAGAKAFLRELAGGYVIKTDGLAAGKGVLVTGDLAEAEADIDEKLSGRAFGPAGHRVVVEERLDGAELSLFAVCDGRRVVALSPAQDFKRIGEGDTGPNTGGMGAYSPVPAVSDAVVAEVLDRIVEPTLATLRSEGIEYRGLLYAGLMLGSEGPKLVEYNVRFGDPETEVVLPRLRSDLTGLLRAAAEGDLRSVPEPEFADDAAVCVVAAAPGYPGAPATGSQITGLTEASTLEGVMVLHAGTRSRDDGEIETAGGRVLCVSALGPDLVSARERAYDAIDRIHFDGMQVRRDIAAAPLEALA